MSPGVSTSPPNALPPSSQLCISLQLGISISLTLSLSHCTLSFTLLSLFQQTHHLPLCSVSCWIAALCLQYSHLFMSHRPPHRYTALTASLYSHCILVLEQEVTRGKVHVTKFTVKCANCRIGQLSLEARYRISKTEKT